MRPLGPAHVTVTLVYTGLTHTWPHPFEQHSWDPGHELLSAQVETQDPMESGSGTGQLAWAEVCTYVSMCCVCKTTNLGIYDKFFILKAVYALLQYRFISLIDKQNLLQNIHSLHNDS